LRTSSGVAHQSRLDLGDSRAGLGTILRVHNRWGLGSSNRDIREFLLVGGIVWMLFPIWLAGLASLARDGRTEVINFAQPRIHDGRIVHAGYGTRNRTYDAIALQSGRQKDAIIAQLFMCLSTLRGRMLRRTGLRRD
jgi:hypothetical protein